MSKRGSEWEAIQDDNRADQKIDTSGTIWSRSGRSDKTILGEMVALRTLPAKTRSVYLVMKSSDKQQILDGTFPTLMV